MTAISLDTFRALVAEARLAPSVHNIQPSRWRLADGHVELLGDTGRVIPVADPAGRDWRISHGTALEGFDLALRARGLQLGAVEPQPEQGPARGALMPIARAAIIGGATSSAPEVVRTRMTWRGGFRADGATDAAALDRLAGLREDVILVRERAAVAGIARLGDEAGLHFLREDDHRVELLRWMRLSRRHADYDRDGLNARAMHLSLPEAWAAGLVLGPLFKTLDVVGLTGALTSEASKTRSASAIVLFHRPIGEDAFLSGRAFYGAWLDIERAGFKACPMSVLADWPTSNATLSANFGIPAGRQLVSVLRIGRPAGRTTIAHARLPVDELIVAGS